MFYPWGILVCNFFLVMSLSSFNVRIMLKLWNVLGNFLFFKKLLEGYLHHWYYFFLTCLTGSIVKPSGSGVSRVGSIQIQLCCYFSVTKSYLILWQPHGLNSVTSLILGLFKLSISSWVKFCSFVFPDIYSFPVIC